jgi:transposase InsO family protein
MRRSVNGNGYWSAACAELAIARKYTRPRRPQTNGKAEALVKTIQREWAYRSYIRRASTAQERYRPMLHWYNGHRAHGSLRGRLPITHWSVGATTSRAAASRLPRVFVVQRIRWWLAIYGAVKERR